MSELSLASLEQCEAAIEKAIDAAKEHFAVIGASLAVIRDRRLWEESHESFAHYCKARWDFGESYASRMIGASGVVEGLLPQGKNLVTSEKQARELKKVDPPKRDAVVAKAAEISPSGVTPTSIREAAEIIDAEHELVDPSIPSHNATRRMDAAIANLQRIARTLEATREELLLAIEEKAIACPTFRRQVSNVKQSVLLEVTVKAVATGARELMIRWNKAKSEVDE